MNIPPVVQQKDLASALPDWLRLGLALPAKLCGATLKVADAASFQPQPPLPEQLSRASFKRQSEYRAGRCCAALALGNAAQAPGMGEDRLPLWPQGWLGSISHGGGHAIAIVGPVDAVRLIGVDVELCIESAAADGIAALVAFGNELALIDGALQPPLSLPAMALTLLFSAKEALYKALYPEVRQFVDFSGARLVAATADRLTLVLTEDWHPAWRAGAAFTVNYVVRGNFVYCVCFNMTGSHS